MGGPGSGRIGQPLAVVKLAGAFRKDRHGGCIEPEPGIPEAPAWLTDRAREYWLPLVERIGRMGILSPQHAEGVGLLCEALADYALANETPGARNPSTTTGSGTFTNPAYRARCEAWKRVLSALREFGLTPSAIRSVGKVQWQGPKPGGLSAFR